jgi:hypothetical protein
MIKHEKIFSDNQHVFILFIVDTFDFLARDYRHFEKSSNDMYKNVVSPVYRYRLKD